MHPTIATRTDVGRVRKNNEDYFISNPELGLYIVCDGMGGHNAGEVASQMTCEVIQREIEAAQEHRNKFLESGKASDCKALRKILQASIARSCKEVYKEACRNPERAGMGTTCTVVWLVGHDKGILGHVGDSRLYVARAGGIYQLSEDHTYVNELLKRGAITREQSKNHPQGNVLSRALGVQPSVAIDTMIFDTDPGDTYMLCSDGLYNYYDESEEILTRLAQEDLDTSLNELIDTALERGGHDNITVIALRIGGPPAAETGSVAARERIEILKQIPIFAHLNYHELVRVLGLTQLLAIEEGAEFIHEGEQGNEMYVLLTGEVEVIKGNEVLASLTRGVNLGEMAMIDNAPRSASVRAKTNSHVLIMRREEFFGIIRGEPVIGTKLLWSLVQVLSGRLRDTNAALEGARKELNTEPVDSGSFEVLFE